MAGRKKKIETLADLTADPRNVNLGTERGGEMLGASLDAYGAGRSVLVDMHGVLIAGNKTAAAALDIGLKARVIDTDGEELVVVRRTDLDLSKDRRARELAIADNRVGEVNYDLDVDAFLAELDEGVELDALYTDAEIELMRAPAGDPKPPGDPGQSRYKEQYGVIVICADEAAQEAAYEKLHAMGYDCKVVST